jgi:hypothetical protein
MSGNASGTEALDPASRTDEFIAVIGHGMVDPSPILVSLLAELEVEAAVLDCSLLPSSDQYGIVVQAPPEGGQAVLVPRLLLERALVDPIARARVRDLLDTVLIREGHRWHLACPLTG